MKSFFYFLLFNIAFTVCSQSEYLLMYYDYKNNYESYLLKYELNDHLFHAPFLKTNTFVVDSSDLYKNVKQYKQLLKKVLFSDNLIHVNKDVELRINPVLDFNYGKQFGVDEKNIYQNTRGFQLQINFNKKFYVYSDFRENQTVVPDFLKNYVDYRAVFLGQGRTKPFKDGGFDYANASGYASFSPSATFNVTFGNGKQFIGNGFRSMLLSDNSHNYTSLKFTSLWLKNQLQWVVNYSSLVDLERMPFSVSAEALFKKKEMIYQTFDYLINTKLSVSLVSMALIKRYDDSLYTQSMNLVNYIPIPFLTNVLEMNNKSEINSFVGLNLSYRLFNTGLLYGQFVFDNVNKTAFQLGIKCYRFLNVNGLSMRIEYNKSSSEMYQSTELRQNFINNSLPIAHILGNNFNEFIFQLDYEYKKIGAHFQNQIYNANVDEQTNYSVIFSSSSNPSLVSKKVLNIYGNLYYRVNPYYNLKLYAGAGYRVEGSNKQAYFNIGVSTLLTNIYKGI